VKKVFAIALALVLLVALAAPAMADGTKDVDTSATVVEGGAGSPPIIKCKWETSSEVADAENGDPSHITAGTQIDPVIDEAAQTCEAWVYYWAFVMDPQGIENIGEVAVDVYEPQGDDPACGTYIWKYKVVLDQIYCSPVDKQAMKDALNAADAADLVTYDPNYDLADIAGDNGQIDQGSVKLYRGCDIIEHHQPGGIYHVEAFAFDLQQDMSDMLVNCFEYVRTEALVKDFDIINWGEVVVCSKDVVCGDTDWATPEQPTVKSTGNCALDVSVTFSEMYRIGDGHIMNEVEFDAYLVGDENEVFPILPDTPTDISHPASSGEHVFLPQCTYTKIGFSIHVIQCQPGVYEGTVTLTGTDNDLPWAGENCANPFCARHRI
jgi:hypothetical protein